MERQPPVHKLRTNIKRITCYITDSITAWGFNVYITISRTTKSRYIQFYAGKWRSFIIRVSDHYSTRKYDYDVYTNVPRRGAMDYLAMLRNLENRLFHYGDAEKTG